jgi:hypothetical protein
MQAMPPSELQVEASGAASTKIRTAATAMLERLSFVARLLAEQRE